MTVVAGAMKTAGLMAPTAMAVTHIVKGMAEPAGALPPIDMYDTVVGVVQLQRRLSGDF